MSEELAEDLQEETQPEEGQESAQEENQEEEKVTFDERQQEVLNKAINKKTARTKEVERELEETRRQVEELKTKIPKSTRPEIPPIPDQYAENYKELIVEREKAITEQAAYDANERLIAENQRIQAQEAQRQGEQKLAETMQGYQANAKTLNISESDLQRASKSVAAMGLSDGVLGHMISEKAGPQIALYLEKNPVIADELRYMNDIQAGVKLSTEIKDAAMAMIKKPEKVPEPAESLKGGGSTDSGDMPDGATFK